MNESQYINWGQFDACLMQPSRAFKVNRSMLSRNPSFPFSSHDRHTLFGQNFREPHSHPVVALHVAQVREYLGIGERQRSYE